MEPISSKIYFGPKDPFYILQNIFRHVMPEWTLYGGYLRDLYDPHNKGTHIHDIDVRMNTKYQLDKLIDFTKQFGYLREMEIFDSTKYGLTSYRLILKINDQDYHVDLSIPQTKNNDTCDFTCNNLIMMDFGIVRPRIFRHDLSDHEWLDQIYDDINNHRLVPMFPSNYLTLDSNTPYKIRFFHMKMIKRAIKMMTRGWTLCPHIDGGELKFTIYEGAKIECVICTSDIIGCPIKVQSDTKEYAIILKCTHIFHVDCIFEHMKQKATYSKLCPCCREPIMFI